MSVSEISGRNAEVWRDLKTRLSPSLFERRLLRQRDRLPRSLLLEDSRIPCDRLPWGVRAGMAGVKMLGLSGLAERSCCNIAACREEVWLPKLPALFDGFTILHLSDLHFGGPWNLLTALRRAVGSLNPDLCVITGDFRYPGVGDFAGALSDCASLVGSLRRAPIVAVLGNHDYVQMVPALEGMGIRVLLNENMAIVRGASRVWVAGVDDSHFFGTADLAAAVRGVPRDGCLVLLSHSPEISMEASGHGVALYLCGHTHGGQFCAPTGYPFVWNSSCPRPLVAGAWRLGSMIGYTSRGAGYSNLPFRLWCPPEITVHRLRCRPRNSAS